MSIKNLNSRIQHKIDIEDKWKQVEDSFFPLKGEFIIYAPDSNYSYSRLKIGDGLKSIKDLPFLSYSAYDIALASGTFKGTEKEWLSSLVGPGISDIESNVISTRNGGLNQFTIHLDNGDKKSLSYYNGQGIDSFEKKEISSGNGGKTEINIKLSTGQEETLQIYNGEGIDSFTTTQSTRPGESSTINFKLSNQSQPQTLSIYNGHSLEEFSLIEESTENGGENKFKIKTSNNIEPQYFSVFNGEKGDKGTSISSINTTPITEGNGGTKVTISLDDNSEPTNFSIYNGEVSEAQLNTIVTNISNDLQLRSKAYSFDKVDDMVAELQRLSVDEIKSQLRIGDVFLIRDVGVPDYWWDPISTEAATIAEYMDKDIIIEGKGACRILETSKLNLSGYCGLDHKKSETDTLSGIKDLSNYKIRIAEDGDEGRENYITLIIPKGVM